jgi:hypothetical protein
MRKLPVSILSVLLVPAVAFAQSAGPPPPPPDAQDVELARPADAAPDLEPPPPPAVPPSRASEDEAAIPQQQAGAGAASVQGSGEDAYSAQSAPAAAPPSQTGQWVYTNQSGWVWMPYGAQYVDEGTYGGDSPYQFVYGARIGWSWVAAPWLWGWGPYPYFGVFGPLHFGWYRGLYRAGYGWGRYRGGFPRGGHYAGGYARGGGGYHGTRPIGGQYVPRSYGSPRIQGRPYGIAPAHGGSFAGGRVTSGGGSFPHANGGVHVGGGHGR